MLYNKYIFYSKNFKLWRSLYIESVFYNKKLKNIVGVNSLMALIVCMHVGHTYSYVCVFVKFLKSTYRVFCIWIYVCTHLCIPYMHTYLYNALLTQSDFCVKPQVLLSAWQYCLYNFCTILLKKLKIFLFLLFFLFFLIYFLPFTIAYKNVS